MSKYFLWISIQKISKTENESLSFTIKHKNDKTKFKTSKLEHLHASVPLEWNSSL